MLRRNVILRAAIVAVALGATCTPSTTVSAQDRELTEATDFRVRVQAALRLGRTGGTASRIELEKGLRDAHPAVRVACAVALGNMGDAASIPPMEAAIRSESIANVKTALRESLDKIKGKGGAGGSGSGGGETSVDKAKYVVQVGNIRNESGVRPDLDGVMRNAARAKASSIKGAMVLDSADSGVMQRAAEKKIPVLLVDGSLSKLTETRNGGAVIITAQVNLSIRKIPQQTLRGTVSGNASATDEAKNPRALSLLQDRAVEGAVSSAMSSMGSEIAALAK